MLLFEVIEKLKGRNSFLQIYAASALMLHCYKAVNIASAVHSLLLPSNYS